MFRLSKHCFLLYNTLQKEVSKWKIDMLVEWYKCHLMEKVEKLRSQGKSVVSLCAGEPDFNTPEGIKKQR